MHDISSGDKKITVKVIGMMDEKVSVQPGQEEERPPEVLPPPHRVQWHCHQKY